MTRNEIRTDGFATLPGSSGVKLAINIEVRSKYDYILVNEGILPVKHSPYLSHTARTHLLWTENILVKAPEPC